MTASTTKFRPQLTIEEVNLIVESLHILLLKGQEFESDPIGNIAPALYKKMNLFAHKSMMGINTPAYKTKPKKLGEEKTYHIPTNSPIVENENTGEHEPSADTKEVTPMECYDRYIELGTDAETDMTEDELMLAAVQKSKFTKDLDEKEQARVSKYFTQYL